MTADSLWAMRFQRRSVRLRPKPLRVLALRGTAAIAVLALAACGNPYASRRPEPDTSANEAAPIGYNTVAGYAEMDSFPAARDLARFALSDGILTEREYDDVIAAADGQREDEYRRNKAAALTKWAAQ